VIRSNSEDRAGGRRTRSLLSAEGETTETASLPEAPQRKHKIKGSKQSASPAKAGSSTAEQTAKSVEQRFREALNILETATRRGEDGAASRSAASKSRTSATMRESSTDRAVVQPRAAAAATTLQPSPEPVLPPVMENEHLLVNVLPNGRLSIQHKDSTSPPLNHRFVRSSISTNATSTHPQAAWSSTT
jgi:hypothetical protein